MPNVNICLLLEVFAGCKLGCKPDADRDTISLARLLRLKLGVEDRVMMGYFV
jgi:hypothetical protein